MKELFSIHPAALRIWRTALDAEVEVMCQEVMFFSCGVSIFMCKPYVMKYVVMMTCEPQTLNKYYIYVYDINMIYLLIVYV
jgi:hypothetical protein